jgi:amino acid adenylation domain-containing protein
MSERGSNLPPEQKAIRDKCFHPSGTFVEFAKEEVKQSIPERFEKMVLKFPNRIAIKTKDQGLTYDELNKSANRTAHEILNDCGRGNRPVAILMEHGIDVLAAILAVLKAGKIYVSLDPTWPVERLRYMLRDAQAELILAQDRTLALAREIGGQKFPVGNADAIDNDSAECNLNLALSPDTLAYIIYTSGSTGQPKGVVDNHRNVLHGTLRFTNGLHISPEDRISFTHSCSSSASIRRIFPAFLNGASLFPFDVKRSGVQDLMDLLSDEAITIFSTGRIRDFVRNLDRRHAFPHLRLVSLGGEIVYRRDIELYRKIFPPSCLIGIWMSITETGNITQFFIDGETRINSDIAPVGYPADDMEILLLDDTHYRAKDGELGEITIRSRYLSPGYWRRPDLTKEKFQADPEGGEARIYFTGDLGRRGPDGCLFHMGRKDDQVKISGYRIEVAEIEAALLNLNHFRKAFVTLRDRGLPEKSLIAYLVPERWPAPTTSFLRKALAAILPSHMIPSVFVMLESLPLTPTRKVDRAALPDPGTERPSLDTPYIAPRTAVEQQLASVWAEVLGLDQVGIHDSFFDLGGHSLAAMRVVSQVLKVFQLKVLLQSVFRSPTIAEMAGVIMEHQGKQLGEEDLERVLSELEALSDEEVQRLLAEKTDPTSGGE